MTDFLQTPDLVEVCDVLGVLSSFIHLLISELRLLICISLRGDFFQLGFELGELVTGHLLRSFDVPLSLIILQTILIWRVDRGEVFLLPVPSSFGSPSDCIVTWNDRHWKLRILLLPFH